MNDINTIRIIFLLWIALSINDYLILDLTESIDDCGAGYESVAECNIACHCRHMSDCLNDHEGNQYDSKEYRDECVRCKLAWLEREYDTYPSEDDKWKVENVNGD